MMKPIAIYIHWPFCLKKCPYCDFNSHVSDNISTQDWLKSYIREIQFFKNIIQNRVVTSIFFGGGTPSLMDPKIVEAIIQEVQSISNLDPNVEITLEANPTSVEAQKFQDFKRAGINRVSIGLQSFEMKELQFLGREHTPSEAIYAVKLADKYFDRYSFDIIYALPNQTLTSLHNTIKKALDLAKDHISLYQLTIEKGTKFFSMHKKGQFTMLDNDVCSEMYFMVDSMLKDQNFYRYEISNYAKRSKNTNTHNDSLSISRHNMCYWKYDEYLGIGPGAHSRLFYDGNIKKSIEINSNYNTKIIAMNMIYNPANWMNKVQNQRNGINSATLLSKNEIITEMTMMCLRTFNGIQNTKVQQIFDSNIAELFSESVLQSLDDSGLIKYSSEFIKPTTIGMNLNNSLIQTLLNHY